MRISDYSLRNLRTFCAVVEHGGFGGAQAVLGASQSVISTHLKDLEVKLGLTLCQRGRAGFALTDKGRDVYQEAKRLLASVETCEANLGTLRQVLTGHLRIGIVDGESDNPNLPLHLAIRRFFAQAGDVRLTLEVGTPEFLGKALQNGDIHAAIGPFPNRQANIIYAPFYVEEHGFYCGRTHALFDRKPETVTLAEIATCPMAVRPYLQRAELAGIPEAMAMASVSNMEAQATLIASGCYLGWLPVHFARKWVERGDMRRIDWLGLEWQSQFYIAHHSDPHDLVRRFVSVVEREFDRA